MSSQLRWSLERRLRGVLVAAGFVAATLAAARGEEPAAVADPPAAGETQAKAPPADADPPADAAPVAGEFPGQVDLDAAIEAKLDVDELDDFARVLSLCRRAVDRGLDDEQRKFAEALYTGTLLDRAGMLVDAIFGRGRPDPQWQRIRGFAMRDLDEVVGRDPGVGVAHLMIARLQALPGGDRTRAAAAAAKALDLIGEDRLQRAQATIVLAELEEDQDRRATLFDQAVDLAPRDAEIRRSRGLFRLDRDDFPGGREDLEVAAEEADDDATIHSALGLACLLDKQPEKARAAFDRAIELEPEDPRPLLQRARAWMMEKDADRALEDIDRAIELDPEGSDARLLRAQVLVQEGDNDGALADVERVLEDDPDAAGAIELRGLIAAEREDYSAAIRDFRRLAARDPDNALILGQLGSLYLAAKQPREAIRRFTRALEIDGDNFFARRGRGDAAISVGDHPAALADLEKALALEPENTGVLNNLAWLLATSPDDEIRDGKRAVELAAKACELTEFDEAHIISTLAAAHAETGDFEQARKFSRQAVEKGADAEEVSEQLAAELASYEAGKPWRERQEMADEGTSAAGAAGEKESIREPEADEEAKPIRRPPRRPFGGE